MLEQYPPVPQESTWTLLKDTTPALRAGTMLSREEHRALLRARATLLLESFSHRLHQAVAQRESMVKCIGEALVGHGHQPRRAKPKRIPHAPNTDRGESLQGVPSEDLVGGVEQQHTHGTEESMVKAVPAYHVEEQPLPPGGEAGQRRQASLARMAARRRSTAESAAVAAQRGRTPSSSSSPSPRGSMHAQRLPSNAPTASCPITEPPLPDAPWLSLQEGQGGQGAEQGAGWLLYSSEKWNTENAEVVARSLTKGSAKAKRASVVKAKRASVAKTDDEVAKVEEEAVEEVNAPYFKVLGYDPAAEVNSQRSDSATKNAIKTARQRLLNSSQVQKLLMLERRIKDKRAVFCEVVGALLSSDTAPPEEVLADYVASEAPSEKTASPRTKGMDKKAKGGGFQYGSFKGRGHTENSSPIASVATTGIMKRLYKKAHTSREKVRKQQTKEEAEAAPQTPLDVPAADDSAADDPTSPVETTPLPPGGDRMSFALQQKQLEDLSLMVQHTATEATRIEQEYYEGVERAVRIGRRVNGTLKKDAALKEGMRCALEKDFIATLQAKGEYVNVSVLQQRILMHESKIEELKKRSEDTLAQLETTKASLRSEEYLLQDLQEEKLNTLIAEYKKQQLRDAKAKKTNAEVQCRITVVDFEQEARLKAINRRETLLRSEANNFRAMLNNLRAFHTTAETDITCRACFNQFEEPVSLYPCGHTMCLRCVAGATTDGILRCADCGNASTEAPVPNHSLALLLYQWLDPRSGVKDVDEVIREASEDLDSVSASLEKWKKSPQTEL